MNENRSCSIKWCVCWISADLWLLIITLCCINVSVPDTSITTDKIHLARLKWQTVGGGAASHAYNPAYHRPHLIIPKSLLNIKQTPFITVHSSTTGRMHQEKCQREALFTLSIRCHECLPLPSSVPSTADTFAVSPQEHHTEKWAPGRKSACSRNK